MSRRLVLQAAGIWAAFAGIGGAAAGLATLRHRPPAPGLSTVEGVGTVVLPSRPPRALDPATGRTTAVAGLPHTSETVYRFLHHGADSVMTVHEPGGGETAYAVTGAEARKLVEADQIVAAAAPGWMLARRGARWWHHDASGAVAGEAPGVPGVGVVSQTRAGILVRKGDSGWALWDPVAGRETAQLRRPVAASAGLAVTEAEDLLLLHRLGTPDRITAVQPFANATVSQAVISPDDAMVALLLTIRREEGHRVMAFDAATGVGFVMPGEPTGRIALSWSHGFVVVAAATGAWTLWRPRGNAMYSGA